MLQVREMKFFRSAIGILVLTVFVCSATPVFADRYSGGGGHRGGGGGYYRGGGHYGGGYYRGGHYRGGYYRGYYGPRFGVSIGWPWYYPPYYYPYYYPYDPYYAPYYYAPTVTIPSEPQEYIEKPRSEERSEPSDIWYYCPKANGYYPYVRECPDGWQTVPALPPSQPRR
jgi:hypothetical protein